MMYTFENLKMVYTFDNYQEDARRTMPIMMDLEDRLTMLSLGLAGEVGEVVEIIKKWRFHGHEIDRHEIEKELGDVMWYLANLATELDMRLEDICIANMKKLKKRYPNGFDKERSRNRES